MAILHADGFEFYQPSGNPIYWDLSRNYLVPSYASTNSAYSTYGVTTGLTGAYWGGTCLRTNSTSTNAMLTFPLSAPTTTAWVGMHLAGYRTKIFTLANANDSSFVQLEMTPQYNPRVIINGVPYPSYRPNGLLDDVGSQSTWSYYEMEVQITGSTLSVKVWRDNVLTVILNNVSGFTSGAQSISKLILGNTTLGGTQSSTSYVYYDNLCLTDGERLGEVIVNTFKPNADPAVKQWLPDSGTINYNRINDGAGRMDTHVYASTVGAKEFYPLPSIQPVLANSKIIGVADVGFGSSNAATTTSARTIIKSGTTEINNATRTFNNTDGIAWYGPYHTINPSTGQPWTVAEINDMQIGIERLS